MNALAFSRLEWPTELAATTVSPFDAGADPFTTFGAADSGGSLTRLIGVGVVLLLLAIGASLWSRRARGGGRRLAILDRLALSRSTSVVVLDVDDRRLLLSVSADGARLIERLDDDESGTAPESTAELDLTEAEASPSDTAPPIGSASFRRVLQRLRPAGE